jgi:hypothetical protein
MVTANAARAAAKIVLKSPDSFADAAVTQPGQD